MGVVEGVGDFGYQMEGLGQGHLLFFPVQPAQVGGEAAPGDVFHDHVEQVVVAVEIVDFDDGGVVEAGGGLGFLQEVLAEGGLPGQVGAHDLEGYRPGQFQVLGLVNRAHAAFAEKGFNLIMLNLLPNQIAHLSPEMSQRSAQLI